MMILLYPTKKDLKACVGQPLKYEETSMFGPEYKSDGSFTGCNRPSIDRSYKKGWREFFARVTMKDGKISKVE
jgi:major membrane immunogen (membrane-anchored lipoprotein)